MVGFKRELRCADTVADGFVSFDPPVAHFGLGAFDRVGRVQIEWNDGTSYVIDQPLEAGRNYVVVRHSPEQVEIVRAD